MTTSQYIGLGIITLVLGGLFYATTKLEGWLVAGGIWLFSLVVTALVVFACFLLAGGGK